MFIEGLRLPGDLNLGKRNGLRTSAFSMVRKLALRVFSMEGIPLLNEAFEFFLAFIWFMWPIPLNR